MQRMAAVLVGLAMAGYGQGAAARQTAGKAIEAARRGGVTIACRHGITDGSQSDAAVVRYDDITTQRRLSAEGEAQSIALGRAFRDLRIPVGDVIASPMQRARRMAELMFGSVIIDSIWYTADDNYGGPRRDARARALAESMDGDVRIIISHQVTLLSVLPTARGKLEEGTCVVVRPSGSGFDVVGIVPWTDWIRAAENERRGPATPQPTPQIFAPGIVPTAAPVFAITFTPDGRTAYFNRMTEDRPEGAAMLRRLLAEDGKLDAARSVILLPARPQLRSRCAGPHRSQSSRRYMTRTLRSTCGAQVDCRIRVAVRLEPCKRCRTTRLLGRLGSEHRSGLPRVARSHTESSLALPDWQ